jgi:hypothetical protein
MKKLLATLILVAAAVAGCGSSSSGQTVSPGGPGGSPVSPTGSASPDPLTPHTPAPGAARVLPTTAPASVTSGGRVSLPWEFMRLADGGKQVEISLQYGGCMTFDYVQVEQGTGSVEITVWGITHAGQDTICPAFEAILRGTITLDAPLGSRQLLHGPVGNHRTMMPK